MLASDQNGIADHIESNIFSAIRMIADESVHFSDHL